MNKTIICDTREKIARLAPILEYLNDNGYKFRIKKLDAGDYMVKDDFSIIIDRKDSLLELCNNLCSKDHYRLVREVKLAHELGCTKFVFLITEDKIKNEQDIIDWTNKHTTVTGQKLFNVMQGFKKNHDVIYTIVPKKRICEKIVDLLTKPQT